ncbi:hypothetical protein [Leptothermofonsia sp. ETS-13]|uniref:hypothetical protein n=1 Tax=Leptothermofonsia sp. ETS-13 TaxID=3035696 RepID=UPI003BA065AB
MKNTPDDWVWTYHGSPDGLRENRKRAIELFCADYEAGKAESRYELGELPDLKYGNGEFDLGLCSHFLFLYSDHFSEQFHFNSVCEMLRVCQEVRIFPLLTLMLKPSQHLGPIIKKLQAQGYQCEIVTVPYELQRGGNEMLRITTVR